MWLSFRQLSVDVSLYLELFSTELRKKRRLWTSHFPNATYFAEISNSIFLEVYYRMAPMELNELGDMHTSNIIWDNLASICSWQEASGYSILLMSLASNSAWKEVCWFSLVWKPAIAYTLLLGEESDGHTQPMKRLASLGTVLGLILQVVGSQANLKSNHHGTHWNH